MVERLKKYIEWIKEGRKLDKVECLSYLENALMELESERDHWIEAIAEEYEIKAREDHDKVISHAQDLILDACTATIAERDKWKNRADAYERAIKSLPKSDEDNSKSVCILCKSYCIRKEYDIKCDICCIVNNHLADHMFEFDQDRFSTPALK